MLYIWLDESDKKGRYYSNFYGGIMIDSRDYEEILTAFKELCRKGDIKEEIKWQKVSAYNYERYKQVVDFIFYLLATKKAKIRIFFRNNQYVAPILHKEQKQNEFTILYYEFIKHSFGFKYCDFPEKEKYIRLYIDDIPTTHAQVQTFKTYILGLNNSMEFRNNSMRIRKEDIIEVDSSKEPMLQLLDLILGSICFRLNNKHKIKLQDTNRRGKKTILKEKLYKYINAKIREIRPNFNIGESTGINTNKDAWTLPYSHWSFKPSGYFRDKSFTKKNA